MKKYEVEYKNCKAVYTAKTLEEHAHEYGMYDYLSDYDFLTLAMLLYCDTHFMFNMARLDSYDGKTNGNLAKVYEIRNRKNCALCGWLYARTIED